MSRRQSLASLKLPPVWMDLIWKDLRPPKARERMMMSRKESNCLLVACRGLNWHSQWNALRIPSLEKGLRVYCKYSKPVAIYPGIKTNLGDTPLVLLVCFSCNSIFQASTNTKFPDVWWMQLHHFEMWIAMIMKRDLHWIKKYMKNISKETRKIFYLIFIVIRRMERILVLLGKQWNFTNVGIISNEFSTPWLEKVTNLMDS